MNSLYNFLTFKEHPEAIPAYLAGVRFLAGWLEKDAFRLPGD